VLVIPWRMSDIESWNAGWLATELDSKATTGADVGQLSPITDAALRELIFGKMINAADSIRADKNFYPTANLFKTLVEAGVYYKPVDTRFWVLRNTTCLPDYADGIAEIALHMLQRKDMDESAISNLGPQALARWRKAAEETKEKEN